MSPDEITSSLNRVLTAALAVLIVTTAIISFAAVTYSNQRTADAAMARKTIVDLEKRVRVVEDRADTSIKDRADIHEGLGRIEAGIGRLEEQRK